ncbi:MIG15 [Enterospora canceri]|uniref:MIG15 n=1 Tax=Enterospora canceri TaxID=1081671 RepID=A0A1Y1S6V0_9MICR|nr:MIG15 [Enterospora canceri]
MFDQFYCLFCYKTNMYLLISTMFYTNHIMINVMFRTILSARSNHNPIPPHNPNVHHRINPRVFNYPTLAEMRRNWASQENPAITHQVRIVPRTQFLGNRDVNRSTRRLENALDFNSVVQDICAIFTYKNYTNIDQILHRLGYTKVFETPKSLIYCNDMYCLKIGILDLDMGLESEKLSRIRSDHVVKLYNHKTVKMKLIHQEDITEVSSEINVSFLLQEKLSFIASVHTIRQCEEGIKKLAKDVLLGISNINYANLIHTDIKNNNIMGVVNDDKVTWKLIDLDLAVPNIIGHRQCHTMYMYWFLPPECAYHGYFTTKSDIWSLGLLLYQLCFFDKRDGYGMHKLKQHLHGHFGYRYSKRHLVNRNSPIPLSFPDHISSDCREFIMKMLIVDYNLRPSASTLIYHRFITA